MGSYPLLSQAPTPVEVELGYDNKNSIAHGWIIFVGLDFFISLSTLTLVQVRDEKILDKDLKE